MPFIVQGRRQHQRDQRPPARGDDDPGQQQACRRPGRTLESRPRQPEDEHGRHERAAERGRRHQRSHPREHCAQRADRGAARDTEDVGVGERIAQQHLHQRAGEREQPAHGKGRQRAGKTQLADDRRRGLGRVAGKRAENRRRATSMPPTATATPSATSEAAASTASIARRRVGVARPGNGDADMAKGDAAAFGECRL
jgi:hypothetical protein